MASGKKLREPPPKSFRPFLDEVGIDRICERIVGGETMTQIAESLGVTLNSLISWVNADPAKYAEYHTARTRSAISWDEKAEKAILDSTDQHSLGQARELASHYRWRAKVIAPKEYGDRVSNEHTGANGGPIQSTHIDLTGLSDAELSIMQKLLTKSAAASEPPRPGR